MYTRKEAVPMVVLPGRTQQEVDEQMQKASQVTTPTQETLCFLGLPLKLLSLIVFLPYRHPCPGKSQKVRGPVPAHISARRPGAARTTEKR